MIRLNSYKKGWLECALDSEGCLTVVPSRGKSLRRQTYHPVVMVTNNNRDFIEKTRDICRKGVVVYRKTQRNPNSITPFHFAYHMPSKVMREILPQLKLIVKERQRILVVELLGLIRYGGNFSYSRDELRRMEEIYLEVRGLNSKDGKARYKSRQRWPLIPSTTLTF